MIGVGFEIYILTVAVLTVILLPLPGVKAETTVKVDGQEVDYRLNPNYTVDSDASSTFIFLKNGPAKLGLIEVGTGWRPLWDYMSQCSHEVKHSELSLDGVREHEIIHNQELPILNVLPPWNYEKQCLGTLDERLYLNFFS